MGSNEFEGGGQKEISRTLNFVQTAKLLVFE